MRLSKAEERELKRRCPGLTIDNKPIGKVKIERKLVDGDKVHSKPGRNIYIKYGKMRIRDGWVLPFNWEKL